MLLEEIQFDVLNMYYVRNNFLFDAYIDKVLYRVLSIWNNGRVATRAIII